MRILLLILIGFVLAGCLAVKQDEITVEPNEIAVIQDRTTGEYLELLWPGTHLMSQNWDVTIYSTDYWTFTFSGSADEENGSIQAVSFDGEPVDVDISIMYHIDLRRVTTLHQRWGNQYVEQLLVPMTRSVVREVVRTVRAEDSYKEGRYTIEMDTLTRLQERLATEGITVDDVILRDIKFTEEFTRSIELTAIVELTATAEVQEVIRTVTPSP